MIQDTHNVKQARDSFSEILGRVKFGKEVITVEKKGKPYAVIMNSEEFEKYKETARKRLGGIIADIQANNANVNEEEAMKEITQVVEEVRQKNYERDRGDK